VLSRYDKYVKTHNVRARAQLIAVFTLVHTQQARCLQSVSRQQ